MPFAGTATAKSVWHSTVHDISVLVTLCSGRRRKAMKVGALHEPPFLLGRVARPPCTCSRRGMLVT